MKYYFLALGLLLSVVYVGCANDSSTPLDPTMEFQLPPAGGALNGRITTTVSGGASGAVAVIQPQPYLKNQIFFEMDEYVVASSTLAAHRNVTTWRLKADAFIRFNDYVYVDEDMWNVHAQIWGWDSNGNQVASGIVDINWNDITRWTSTVQVNGQSLDIENAGILFEQIADDLETQGPGKTDSAGAELLKLPCWAKFLGAASAVLAFVTVSGAALTACGSLGGPVALMACIKALLGQGIGIGLIGAAVLNWLCDCWEGYREQNPELCEDF